jgi:Pyruvate kinase
MRSCSLVSQRGAKYPVKAVETMVKIAKWNESRHAVHKMAFDDSDPTGTIAGAVASIVHSNIKPKIDAILVFTETGFTARALATYRLSVPVIVGTENKHVAEALSLSYGIHPVVIDLPTGPFSSAESMIKQLLTQDMLHSGQTIVVVHGHHWQKAGNTNSLSIITL